jgi:hypothetical protein
MCGLIPLSLRRQFERLFQCDFSGVSIHIGPEAESVGAAAFALGNRIYLRPDTYNPARASGRQLLGHELAHVVQYRQGRTPRLTGGKTIIYEDSALESEAHRFSYLARSLYAEQLPGWVPAAPAPLAQDGVIQRSILRYENKIELRKMIEDIVKQVPPDGPSTTAQLYGEQISKFIMDHPHIFSGEKFSFGDAKAGDKLPKSLAYKLPVYVEPGVRIDLRHADNNDRKWILKTATALGEKHRFAKPGTRIRTRIVSDDESQWVAWATSDCVFTGILIVLGLRFKGQTEGVKIKEKEIETELAQQLSLPRRTLADQILVILLEERLQWERMPVDTLATLYSKASDGAYIVSYCEDEGRDFWHVVYGELKGKKWTWVDRQWERQYGSLRASLRGDTSAEANAWKIDADSALVKQLRTSMDIANLKTTNRQYLA